MAHFDTDVRIILVGAVVLAVPLRGEACQSTVRLHLLDDFADLGCPFWIILFGDYNERLTESILALNDLHGISIFDGVLCRLLRSDDCVDTNTVPSLRSSNGNMGSA